MLLHRRGRSCCACAVSESHGGGVLVGHGKNHIAHPATPPITLTAPAGLAASNAKKEFQLTDKELRGVERVDKSRCVRGAYTASDAPSTEGWG